jgi:hypothetical protein
MLLVLRLLWVELRGQCGGHNRCSAGPGKIRSRRREAWECDNCNIFEVERRRI